MAKKETTTAVVKQQEVDSEEARRWATWALSYHEGTKIGAQMTVLNALACGIQLQKAKAALPHGQFMAWRKKYTGNVISARTTANYLALTTRMEIAQGPKFATVANLIDVAPEDFTPEYAQKIMPKINKLIEGKTVRELYESLNIIKPRQTKTEKARQRIGPSTGDPEKDAQARARVWASDTLEKLQAVKYFAKHISDEDLTSLIHSMISAAAELGVALVEAGEKSEVPA